MKLYPDAASALDGLLRDGLLIASGGFGVCGIPERLLDALQHSDAVCFTNILC